MSNEIPVETIENAIEDVRHPEVDATLVDLGMVDDIAIEDSEAIIDVAIPMTGIPDAIKQMLAQRLAAPLESLDVDLSVQFVLMDQETRERFFEMEEDNWSGLEEGDDSPRDTQSDAPF